MAQLAGMGFPEIRCQKALLATGNSDAEAAMEWLFAHMDDIGSSVTSYLPNDLNLPTDIDEPIRASTAPTAEPSPEQIGMLVDMGFTPAQGRKALKETVRLSDLYIC